MPRTARAPGALNRIDFAQPPPAPSTSPKEKPPQATSPRNSSSARRPSRMSDMCTSTAAKPARMKAAAISTWLFTPCSRRIATRGLAPVAMDGAAGCRRAGSNVSSGARPGSPGVAARPHRPRPQSPGCRAGSACGSSAPTRSRAASLRSKSRTAPPARRNTSAVARRDARRGDASSRRRLRGEAASTAGASALAHLHDGAEFLGKQRAEQLFAACPPADPRRGPRGPQRPSRQRHEQAAIGAVVVGKQQRRAGAVPRWQRKSCRSRCGVVEVRDRRRR